MLQKIKLFLIWETFLTFFFIFILLTFGLMIPGFLDMSNLLYSINDFAYIALAAIPMTFVIITGGIDVSVGSIMGLSSITLGVLWMNGMNIWLALFMTLLVSVGAGFVNGIIVATTTVQPLVVTLGGMFLFSGIALVLSGGSSASGYEGISGFPNTFVELANGQLLGIPNSVWVLFSTIVLFGALLHLTRYGRNVFLVGINIKAARFSGISTILTLMSTIFSQGLEVVSAASSSHPISVQHGPISEQMQYCRSLRRWYSAGPVFSVEREASLALRLQA